MFDSDIKVDWCNDSRIGNENAREIVKCRKLQATAATLSLKLHLE